MNYDLSKLNILSFEICDTCNLSQLHPQCPINSRQEREDDGISVEMIVSTIQQAKEMNFAGYVAFHFYNEPLMATDKILEVIKQLPNQKYLLWTNGTLLGEKREENEFLNLFSRVIITCYSKDKMVFFTELKKSYPQITIIQHKLDDRLRSYSRQHNNYFSCKRPLYELPIDYNGNIYLCCYDWDNSYKIGNINKQSFKEIINGTMYQDIIGNAHIRLMNQTTTKFPEICRKCDKPMIRWPKLSDI